jgi:hypothetical protein
MMTYLEAVEVVKEIEKKYDVMSVRYHGVSVWPFLRLYLLDRISRNIEIKASGSVIRIAIRSLFSYNPFVIFKKHNIWLFVGCERRKIIGDKMIHRVSGGISVSFDKCLMVEKPDIRIGHYKRKQIEETNIVSESWLLILFHLILFLSKPFTPKIENESIIQQILIEFDLKYDYRHYVRSLNAKRLALRCLLAITRKPELAIMECPYDSMGYMWAFHQKGIKVLELQHGVAGPSHNAYNAKAYEKRMNPDCICVYGSQEYKYFTEEEPQYAPNVYMTGLYMLEKADQYFCNDIFNDLRKNYQKIIVCSGQQDFEDVFASFIDQIACVHQQLFFIYIPRRSDAILHFTSTNINIARDVNIYQYLKWADLHMTISSTTCLEAQYYKKPTIFYDYNKRASTYYGNQLLNRNGAYYIGTIEDFDVVYNEITRSDFLYLEVFAHNHVDRIQKVISEYIR